MIGPMEKPQPIDTPPRQQIAASSPATKTSLAHRPWLLALVLAVVTVVVYFPALGGGFVFDDDNLITRNRLIHASDGLYRFWFTTEAPDYYPLTWSLWWLEWRLWGNGAMGYHVVNVLLHAVNAILVWTILQRLKIPGAWLAALVFAIHPVNVATVAWISEQKNALSMLFYAGSILLYLKFDEDGGWPSYALSLAAFLLALLSKTAVVMLPVVLLGCAWWRRSRIQWEDLLRSLPFFALSLVSGLTTIWFQHNRASGGHAVRTDGFLSHLVGAGWVPWFYLSKALVPFNLSVIYPQWKIQPSLWVSWLPGIILVGCLALFWWKRKTWGRPLLFALGYFVVSLFPVLGFFDQGFYQYSLVSDHWQYFAIVAPIALVIVAIELIYRRRGAPVQDWEAGVVIALLLVLGIATCTRAGVYATAETLWRDTIAKNPNAWVAHNNLALVLQGFGNLPEAVGHYEQALRIKPDFAEAHNNFGTALQQAGNLAGAKQQYQQALRIKPDFAEAHINLGVALTQMGRLPEAIDHFEQALRTGPNDPETHYNLGVALEQSGRAPEAVEHYERALQFKPDFADARTALARLQAGR
jgi:protein O-mannosyl-transferase